VLLRLALVGLVLAATACGGGAKGTTTTTAAAAPKSSLPPGCTVPEVERIVTGFLTDPSLAPAGEFEVYASYESDGRKVVARSRSKALAELKARKAAGEVSRLIQLRVAPQDFNHARITFQLTRRAPDYTARKIHSRLVNGGGTVDCAHGKIAAWVTKGP
jgi:hypothetical protein